MSKKLTLEPTELFVNFAYIDNRDSGFLFLSPKFPPRDFSQKEDGFAEERAEVLKKFNKFFHYEHVRTRQGKDVVAKWTKTYIQRFAKLQDDIRQEILNELVTMTEDDIDDDYHVNDASHSKQTY